MGYFHLGIDNKPADTTGTAVPSPRAQDHANKLHFEGPFKTHLDPAADKLTVKFDMDHMVSIVKNEIRAAISALPAPTPVLVPQPIREPSEELKKLQERMVALSADVNAARDYAERSHQSVSQVMEGHKTAVEKAIEAAKPKPLNIAPLIDRVNKAESDIRTLIDLIGDREKELQALAKKHARLFGVVAASCAVLAAVAAFLALR